MIDLGIRATLVILVLAFWRYAIRRQDSLPFLMLALYLTVYLIILPFFQDDTLLAWRYVSAGIDGPRQTYLIGSICFLIGMFVSLYGLNRINTGMPAAIWGGVYRGLTWRGLLLAYALFAVVCFAVQTSTFGSPLYMFEAKDQFAAASQYAEGHWYLVILSSSLIVPTVLLMGKATQSLRSWRFALVALVLALAYFLICAPSTRTWAVAIILSLVFYRAGKVFTARNLATLVLVGAVSYAVLAFLDVNRRGATVSDLDVGELSSSDQSFKAVALLFIPYEDALIAIDQLDRTRNWYYFKYLAGAATPLQLVPKALFPYRPDSDKETDLTKNIFGEIKDIEFFHDDSTLTYTVMGAGYTDCGLPGCLVAGVVYGLLILLFAGGLQYPGPGRIMSMYNLIQLFAGYRLSNEVNLQYFYTTLMFLIVIGMLNGLARVRR